MILKKILSQVEKHLYQTAVQEEVVLMIKLFQVVEYLFNHHKIIVLKSNIQIKLLRIQKNIKNWLKKKDPAMNFKNKNKINYSMI